MARKWDKRSAVHRALKIDASDYQRGADVRQLQQAHNARASQRGMRRVAVDGIFGPDTFRGCMAIGYALGAKKRTLAGSKVTGPLQAMIRFPRLRNPVQLRRARQRKLEPVPLVHYPIKPTSLITDSWGWHPGVHDGVDLICPPRELLFAACAAHVVRADAGGWWGLGAPSDPGLRAKGDGVIILRSLADAGPIRKGMNLCYGHAEGASVREGDTVVAGQPIGHAGLANAWHVHFMVNQRGDTKGVGDRDPRPILNWLKKETS